MVIAKTTPDSEADVVPSEHLRSEMARYNDELRAAGVLLAAEGLKASATGVRVQFSASGATAVAEGPFADAKELVAGYWIVRVSSKDEVIAWVKRIPHPDGFEYEVEIREMLEAEDSASP